MAGNIKDSLHFSLSSSPIYGLSKQKLERWDAVLWTTLYYSSIGYWRYDSVLNTRYQQKMRYLCSTVYMDPPPGMKVYLEIHDAVLF
jgi:hypothetical protein